LKFLAVYVIGSVVAVIVLALLAFKLRKLHGMRPLAVVLLALTGGLVWPLLEVAVVQVVFFGGIAKGLRVVGERNGRVVQPTNGYASDVAESAEPPEPAAAALESPSADLVEPAPEECPRRFGAVAFDCYPVPVGGLGQASAAPQQIRADGRDEAGPRHLHIV